MGMSPPPAASVEWKSLPFHQKFHHLLDHASDFIMMKYKWWLPSVGVSMLVSLVMFSPEGPIPELMNFGMTYGSPMVQGSVFGRRMPNQEGGPLMDEEEGEDSLNEDDN